MTKLSGGGSTDAKKSRLGEAGKPLWEHTMVLRSGLAHKQRLGLKGDMLSLLRDTG